MHAACPQDSANYCRVNLFGSGKCQTCRVRASQRLMPANPTEEPCARTGFFYAVNSPAKKVSFTFETSSCGLVRHDRKEMFDLARSSRRLEVGCLVVAQDS